MQNFVYEWVDFSIFSEAWAKIGLNLRKFEKQKTINKKKGGGNFVKILTKIGSVGIWMGHFFVSPELSSVRDYVITHSVCSRPM